MPRDGAPNGERADRKARARHSAYKWRKLRTLVCARRGLLAAPFGAPSPSHGGAEKNNGVSGAANNTDGEACAASSACAVSTLRRCEWAAALLATQLVGEPITLNLIAGLVAVFAGIWIATTEKRKA